jgi:hypothetical protein
MKIAKTMLVIMAAGFIAFGLSGVAMAFHSGGVGHCNGCHSMHNSQDGAPINDAFPIGDTGNSFLLVGSDPSSTCLSCHARIYRALSTDEASRVDTYTPGGDFWWVTQDTPLPRGNISPGESHGHNVIADDFGLLEDPTQTEAPNAGGGTPYLASWLGCNSCHDPHGKKDNNVNPDPIAGSGSYGEGPAPAGALLGNYRLLGGMGYDGGEQAAGINFAAGDPVAESYHGVFGQWPAETDTNHADYGSGMSEWCANCHYGFTADGSLAHRHPASNDAHLNGFADNYNRYLATGDLLVAPDPSASFDRLVPFERGVTEAAYDGDQTLLDHTGTVGPDTNSNVACISCHREHASAFGDMLRWDEESEIITESPILADATYGPHAYYGDDITTRYNEWQRQLCNRCHLQD